MSVDEAVEGLKDSVVCLKSDLQSRVGRIIVPNSINFVFFVFFVIFVFFQPAASQVLLISSSRIPESGELSVFPGSSLKAHHTAERERSNHRRATCVALLDVQSSQLTASSPTMLPSLTGQPTFYQPFAMIGMKEADYEKHSIHRCVGERHAS